METMKSPRNWEANERHPTASDNRLQSFTSSGGGSKFRANISNPISFANKIVSPTTRENLIRFRTLGRSISRADSTRWMKYIKKKGSYVAVESACEECGLAAQQGYPLLSWDEVVDSCSTSSTFKSTFMKCREVRAARETKDFREQSVASETRVGYKVERTFLLLTVDEFQKKIGLAPKTIGVKVDDIYDEEGNKGKYIVLKDDGTLGNFYRKLTVFYSVDEAGLRESYQDFARQLRKDQGTDCMNWLQDEKVKRRVGRMRKTGATMTPTEVFESVKAQKPTATSAASAASTGDTKAEGARDDLGSGDSDDEDDNLDSEGGESESSQDGEVVVQTGGGPSLRLDEPAVGPGRRGRGRGRLVAGRGKASSSVTLATPSKTPLSDGESVGPSSAAKAGTAEKLVDNVSIYTHEIDITAILAGKSCSDKIYQARRTLRGLQRIPGTEGDQVRLEGHIRLAEVAKAFAFLGRSLAPWVRAPRHDDMGLARKHSIFA